MLVFVPFGDLCLVLEAAASECSYVMLPFCTWCSLHRSSFVSGLAHDVKDGPDGFRPCAVLLWVVGSKPSQAEPRRRDAIRAHNRRPNCTCYRQEGLWYVHRHLCPAPLPALPVEYESVQFSAIGKSLHAARAGAWPLKSLLLQWFAVGSCLCMHQAGGAAVVRAGLPRRA